MHTEETSEFSGSHSKPEAVSVLRAVLAQATTPRRPVSRYDDSVVSSFATHAQLCSAGFTVGVCVTAFHSRFAD